MSIFDFLLAVAALIGHFSLCVAFFNRLHGTAIPRKLRRLVEIALLLGFFLVLGYYALVTVREGLRFTEGSPRIAYPLVCCGATLVAVFWRILPQWLRLRPAQLISNHKEVVDLARLKPIPVHGRSTEWMAALPGNEIFRLHVQQKLLRIADLPGKLNGFSIAHLSDLHFTGDIGREYFDGVIDQAIALDCDAVIVSGDIIESVACEPWIAETLGRINAAHGKYFILGNHDLRMPDVARVRSLLEAAGYVDLGGKILRTSWRDCPVLLVGNEYPWFAGPSENDLRVEATSGDAGPFRVLVSHSPDRLQWARRHRFQLMLAGHNHGGQICFPVLGPLVAPSLYGVRYAGGVYYQEPTLLHVSRGISAEHPIRWNCPPELARLVLRCG